MHAESLKHHIHHLEDTHRFLDRQLILMEKQHLNDSVTAQNLKKKKLHVKDEIERCRQRLETVLK
jgi:hypothetical protein